MRNEIRVSVTINRPPSRVFAHLVDLKNWPQWGGDLASMEQISAGSLGIGSTIRQVTKSKRNARESVVEVTEYVPDQRFGIKSSNLEGGFTLEPCEGGTRLNARFEVEASGLAALMYRVMLKQFVMNDLRKFKRIVETHTTAAA
ncbi:MAG: SRPBCC family protein [Anaerolineae bacterium]